MPAYSPICPHCGSGLTVAAQRPSTPPWLCRACSRGWWVAELTEDSRELYRKERGDFRPHQAVRAAVYAERELATQRGTSLREDQFTLVPVTTLTTVAATRLATDFAAALAVHTKGTE